ncbi:MAG: hypothetical protein ACLTMP_10140 [Eggerthella lenta]
MNNQCEPGRVRHRASANIAAFAYTAYRAKKLRCPYMNEVPAGTKDYDGHMLRYLRASGIVKTKPIRSGKHRKAVFRPPTRLGLLQ